MKEKKKKDIFYFATFVLSMIFRMVQTAGEFQMRIAADDIGMLSSPAYLAGYDWSSTVADTNYYGAAYYMLFTPVLKFVSNPCMVWLIILWANITLLSLACVLSYHIAVQYLDFKAGMLTSLTAVLCSMVVGKFQSMTQEFALFALSWLAAFLLVKMLNGCKNRTTRYLYPIALAFLCGYAYLVHSRAIVFSVTLFLVFVMYAFYDKSGFRCLLCFGGVLVFVIVIATVIKGQVISVLWALKETKIGNVSVSVSSNTIKTMLSPTGLRVLADMSISNLFTAAGRLFGINIIAIVMGTMLMIGIKFNKCAFPVSISKKALLLFSLAGYILGVLGVSVVWGKGVVPVYFEDSVSYSYKGFIYFRYSATFLGPAALVALGECIHNRVLRAKIKWPVLASTTFVILYQLFFVFGKIKDSTYVNSAMVSYFNTEASGLDMGNLKATILILVLALFFIFSEEKKDFWRKVGLTFCVSCCFLPYVGNGLSIRPQLNQNADSGYRLVKFLEEADIFPDVIYCSNSTIARCCQFHLKEYLVIVGYPSGERNCELLFSNTENKNESIPEEFNSVKLDSNEWVWIGNSELYDIIVDYVSWKEEQYNN